MADDNNSPEDFVEAIQSAITSVMSFYSFTEMSPWNVKEMLNAEFVSRYQQKHSNKPSEAMMLEFFNTVSHVSTDYAEIKAFFDTVLNETVAAVKDYAGGGSYPGLSRLRNNTGKTQSSIRGKMISDFHFVIYADESGHYRFLHLGMPRDWNAWLGKVKPSMKERTLGAKFLKISKEYSADGEDFVMMVQDKSGELTPAFRRMVGNAKGVQANPFIPTIMQNEWSSRWSSEYQAKIVGQLIPRIVDGYIRARNI